MKQMNTPKFIFLLLLFSVFTIEGTLAKVNPSNSGTLLKQQMIANVDYALSEDTQTLNHKAVVPKNIPTSAIPNFHNSLPASNASQRTLAAAVVSPVMADFFVNGFWQGLFYGILLLLIIINFVSFLLFDEKIYLVFGSSLIALSAFLFYSDGMLAYFNMQMLHNAEILKASFYLVTAIAAVIFGSFFLNINTAYPKLKYIATGIFSAAAIVIISGWFIETGVLAVVSNILATTVVLSYFAMGLLLFSKKNYAKLYVIAMAFPILFTVDYLFAGPFSISFLEIGVSHLKIAVIAQVLLLTYAILYRMKEIKEENLIKQTELKIFLKRQEMTAREKTEKHIEDEYLENVIMQYDLDGFEIKLLQYISEGKSNKKIARKLKLAESELEEVTNDLYQKLEIREHIKEDYHLIAKQPDFIYN